MTDGEVDEVICDADFHGKTVEHPVVRMRRGRAESLEESASEGPTAFCVPIG